jgi:hypothetical protein
MKSVDQVAVSEADGVFVLGIADAEWNGLIFQIPISNDLIPDNLTYYVCLSDDQQGLDGGVLSVRLGSQFLELSFTEQARAELSMPDLVMRWKINLSVSDGETLRQGLARIFTYGVEAQRPSLFLDLE